MSHNHSPKSDVGRHGLTLKFNKVCVFAYKCTVPRGNIKSSDFQVSKRGSRFYTGTHACRFYLHAERILMQVHASRERLVRALVSTTLGGKGSIRKANQQELYFAHNSEKKT